MTNQFAISSQITTKLQDGTWRTFGIALFGSFGCQNCSENLFPLLLERNERFSGLSLWPMDEASTMMCIIQMTVVGSYLVLMTAATVSDNSVFPDSHKPPPLPKLSLKPMLYPRESESREIKELNGLWKFRADDSPSRNEGFTAKWYSQRLSETGPVILMPVPSSFNDVTQDRSLRDFVGWVWYDREFYPPMGWKQPDVRVVLRFASAHYNTVVWLNGNQLMTHEGGHLPFEAEVTPGLKFAEPNVITVAINNTLSPTTLPPGDLVFKNDPRNYPPGYFVQDFSFDFFNYAGIHRWVHLYTTPRVYVSDITVNTDFVATTGLLNFTVVVGGRPQDTVVVTTQLRDPGEGGRVVSKSQGLSGNLTVDNAKLWWPYTMSEEPGYQYTLEVSVLSKNIEDIYRLPVGFRTVSVTNKRVYINDKPFYFHGVNKHEDNDVRGKGLDLPLTIKDINLMKWMGANSLRTSHYPYAEEFMDLCDQHGIVVIDESPGVGIRKESYMGNVSLAHHLEVMTEMYQRDKNRPSVVMWSVANEPDSTVPTAPHYFGTVINFTRSLDPTRLVTFTLSKTTVKTELVAQWCDVLCLNTYFSWYSDSGHLELVQMQSNTSLWDWHLGFNKTIIQTEYGADTIPGLHMDPPQMFTEEYQCDMLAGYHATFDLLRPNFLTGELIWNFADFMTVQSTTRVVGNKKGVFTRHRQPKAAAHLLRRRYLRLAEKY